MPRRFLTATRPLELWALASLLVFSLIAVLGYWNFALHPERLAGAGEMGARFFSISFRFFAQLHIVLAGIALAVVLIGRLRMRWLPALLAVYALSFFSEHMGTGFGIPFGGYAYTDLLGPKLGGRVPALIPVSWFLMALPSWVLARAAFPRLEAKWARLALGSAWLMTWDLALDPAMSFLTPYWRWAETGPYYGMPWINLFGWYVTGLVLMTALDLLAERTGLDELPVGWMAAYYGVVTVLPVGMVAAAGLWPAVLTTLLGISACVTVSALAHRSGSKGSRSTRTAPMPAGAR